jgi:hypothetical protein
VVLPFEGPVRTLELQADAAPGRLDVHFSVDTTASFGEEIDAMQRDLERRIVPELEDRVDDVAFGVSRFEDFPVRPFGAETDRPFQLLTPIETDLRRVGSAVAALDSPLGQGGDPPEAGAEALWQLATGEGLAPHIDPFRASPGATGTLGGAGFREGALHGIVHITDAPVHAPADYRPSIEGTHGLQAAIDALGELDVRVLGIASGAAARPHLEQLALATSATTVPDDGGSCSTGIDGSANAPVGGRCPLVFDVREDGTGLTGAVVDAIVGLVQTVRYDEVYGRALQDPFDFVRAIAATEAEPEPSTPAPELADRRPPGDGVDDTFIQVRSGTRLHFEVRLQNRTLPPAADYEQTLRLRVEIRGDGRVLEERTLRVVVPRGRPGAADAGAGLDGGSSQDAAMDATVPSDAAPMDANPDANPG